MFGCYLVIVRGGEEGKLGAECLVTLLHLFTWMVCYMWECYRIREKSLKNVQGMECDYSPTFLSLHQRQS
jgi:hypothetical protein